MSEALNDVIGRAVANRKIGECYAELGNIEAALKVSRPNPFKGSLMLLGLCKHPLVPVLMPMSRLCFLSTSGATWIWLALSKITPRSKGLWPPLVELICSVTNRTNRERVWSRRRMRSGRACPLWTIVWTVGLVFLKVAIFFNFFGIVSRCSVLSLTLQGPCLPGRSTR